MIRHILLWQCTEQAKQQDLEEKRILLDGKFKAMIGIREIQTKLWETMPDDQYEKLEPEFDTAIAAMMAHMCGVMPAHAQPDQENSQDILMPAT